MLRTLPRAAGSSLLAVRTSTRVTTSIVRPLAGLAAIQQHRDASSHAISNPTLAGIEKRWDQMPPQEQANLWMALRDRMKNDWHELTLQERKAAYWIAFGPHGPRKLPEPGENWKVAGWTAAGIAVSFGVFLVIRAFAGGAPPTMTKEWQEATNEYLKSQNAEPISGISSEGYEGKGAIQSKSKKAE